MTYTVPNLYTSDLSREDSVWHFRGGKTVALIQGWSVPSAELRRLNISAYHQAFLTSNGYWCASYSDAVTALKNEPKPYFSIKGNCLSMFIHQNWAEENGNPNPNKIYHIVRGVNSWETLPV